MRKIDTRLRDLNTDLVKSFDTKTPGVSSYPLVHDDFKLILYY